MAPAALLWVVLPARPMLTCPFAPTLQMGWENVGRGGQGRLAKDAT